MTRTRRSVFEFDDSSLQRPRPEPARVAAATGEEAPVASPALEMQRALDEMFATPSVVRTDYARGAVMTAATLMTIAACIAFWWEALRWAASLIA